MSTPYPVPLTAAQVGTYFVDKYYQVLQQRPELVHQFYTDASTMLRLDGCNRDSAASLLQIHVLIMSLNYTRIEIKIAHALESWNRGVLVMVSGSVQVKNLGSRRKFVETFFLAPQEKGFFVLNDVFHFTDDEPVHLPAVLLAQRNLDSQVNSNPSIQQSVPTYMMGGEIQAREFVPSADVKENNQVDRYCFQEQPLQQVPGTENILGEHSIQESNDSLQSTVTTCPDQLHTPMQAEEPPKHTYASILRGQSARAAPPRPSVNMSAPSPHASEWNRLPEATAQQATVTSNSFERSVADTFEDFSAVEDEGEIKSVYVRNLLPTVSETEIEEEFKNFGRIAPDGVVIRGRKDIGVCYAFVEFEDMAGVHNAVKAGSANVAGQLVYVEERRPNSNIPFRAGRGRGRGRGSFLTDAPRVRFGSRSFGRGGGYDGLDCDYDRPRGDGYYRPYQEVDKINHIRQFN
ncbi:hypothetical protein K2173_003717 [Erythroxylum novogranatense]|uniref:G3BP-like protein n=1 Tax=Erythroxylum novogranatense TaxID=1862640 RepID=A0AAV8TCS9_9ROSI|nr:hypothetical protein K2173_003717 [Erythroxylum novogranatense]